jgi:lysophospholipase L1-like esterase
MLAASILALAMAAGCSPTSPSSPSNLPQISCPAPQTAESPDGTAVVVNYPNPVVTGGSAPVTVTCAPPSGGTFPLGRTDVGCGAIDAKENGASCAFPVTVSRTPQISATRFLAFGDSITYGSSAECAFGLTGELPSSRLVDVQSLWANANAGASYPSVLHGFLTTRYKIQSIEMTNAGVPGEIVSSSGTQARLNATLSQTGAQVLLLQEGVNDLNGGLPASSVASSLTTMVRSARGRGVHVFLGTLLPQRPGSCRAFAPDAIAPANALIRTVAVAEGVPLVDLYASFAGREGTLLGQDGLHPTPAGYEEIAQRFYEAIRNNLETTPQITSRLPFGRPAR